MLSNLTTKMALRKAGLSSTSLDFSLTSPSKNASDSSNNNNNTNWSSWMTPKSLPLKVHPWFSPPPPPVKVAPVPRIGDAAPQDRQRRLELGRSRCLVVFLRCVGCAFAQKTFLTLRAIANRHAGSITCIAVSHASPRATSKWIDMLGGAWNVHVVIDQQRAVYAAWGLGVASSLWYVLGPTAQVQAWRETGWLGEKVASAVDAKRGRDEEEERRVERILTPRKKGGGVAAAAAATSSNRSSDGSSNSNSGGESVAVDENNPSTELGSKWQESGAFAVDGTGTVVWGGKAARADDVMDLEEGAKLLML